jgi:VWFA-related protein
LVLVDVVVTDKDGRPVRDLTREEFELRENGQPQRIASFTLEQPSRERPPEPQPLPPNVYTNRPEYSMPPGPLTILLLDGLNTPVLDQAYARDQMLRYLRSQHRPGQRTAILALGNSLLILQNFTADPQLLLGAIDKSQVQRSVGLAREEASQSLPPEGAALLAQFSPQALDNLERFETERTFQSTDVRIQTTLGALRAIARATAGFRGRKNLIWVSSAFPFALVPEQAENFDLYRSYANDMWRTANLLADAQVAVYPVDAGGLVGVPAIDSSESLRSPTGQAIQGQEFGALVSRQLGLVASSHMTMNQLAADTGGRSYYNRNDIDTAVELAVADGSIYYTLGYYPEKKDWDGKFRRLEIKLSREGLHMRHRRGYYALDPTVRPELAKGKSEKTQDDIEKQAKIKDKELLTALSDPLPATVVTFRAHVPTPAPAARTALVVEFLVDAHTLAFEQSEDARQHCSLDFLVAAFSPEGKVMASASQTVDARLRPESYQRAQQQGLPHRMQLDLEPGRYQLRLVVRDNRTGWLGTADVPMVIDRP